MAILVHDPLNTPEPPICDAPDLAVFERLVKGYYHAKFWASNLKIEQVMPNFVFHYAPVTNLPVELGALCQLISYWKII